MNANTEKEGLWELLVLATVQLLCWEEILKLCNLSVTYWIQSSYHLTFDFPLQLGFTLHLSPPVSTIQLPTGFLLKAASDIKFQLNYSMKSLEPKPLRSSVQGNSYSIVFWFGFVLFFLVVLFCFLLTSYNLGLSIDVPLSVRSWNVICCQLITK